MASIFKKNDFFPQKSLCLLARSFVVREKIRPDFFLLTLIGSEDQFLE